MNGGGPAFPGNASSEHFWGMSLRDYFAAAALTGLCADPNVELNFTLRAEWSYSQADAMLAERNKAAT